MRLHRASLVRVTLLSGLAALEPPPTPALAASSGASLSDSFRRAVVRSAQTADAADALWQQVAGEVAPPWADKPKVAARLRPPDAELTAELLSASLSAAGRVGGVSVDRLQERLPQARKEALLLYGERFSGLADAGTWDLEMFATWRVIQDLLGKGGASAIALELGREVNSGSIGRHASAAAAAAAAAGRGGGSGASSVRLVLARCDALLDSMRRSGLIRSHTLLTGSTVDRDLALDSIEDEFASGATAGWQFLVEGSALLRASQLCQSRADNGIPGGAYPGQLVSAPLQALLSEAGLRSTVAEFYLDPRGRPDPRTFVDTQFYSTTLLDFGAVLDRG